MRSPRRIAALAALGLGISALAACTPTVSLQPAPDANNPLCANVMVVLPDSIAANDPSVSLQRLWTDAQATAVWGDPVAIYFRCGVEEPAASELPCQTFSGIDWIIDDSDAPWFRMTTFGRSPAVEVYFNSEVVGSSEVLGRVAKAGQDLVKTGQCTDRVTDESTTSG